MHIALEHPNQPDIVQLIADLDAYQLSLYPAESVYSLDITSLSQPNVLFAVARTPAGVAVGCGALVLTLEYGELKRMYVKPALRGQGVARRLLDTLESAAGARGCRRVLLETGPYQHAALAMYQRHGYGRCARFGDYPDDPFSIFMDKQLAYCGAA
jgi:putative acetyltransferase